MTESASHVLEAPLAELVVLVTVAIGVGVAVKFVRVPYTTALVVVGLAASLFARGDLPIQLSEELVFLVILPPLLFQGSLHMDLGQLRHNAAAIALLAFPALLLAVVFVGVALHLLLDLPLLWGLLFGAMVSATDPISVLAIFRRVEAPERLRALVEGESLFNDGTSVVVFAALWGMLEANGSESAAAAGGGAALEFLKVCLGGAVVGLAFGYGSYRLLKKLDDHLLEVMVTIVVVFGSFLLAERLHVSGVIAVVCAGLILGNWGRTLSMAPKTRESVENFWEVADFLINALLFLLLGLEMARYHQAGMEPGTSRLAAMFRDLGPSAIAIVVVLASRALAVYGTHLALHRSRFGHPFGWNHILVWGGLRGSIPIALLLGLPQSELRDRFLVLAANVVLFSLLVQALTLAPLIRRCSGRHDG